MLASSRTRSLPLALSMLYALCNTTSAYTQTIDATTILNKVSLTKYLNNLKKLPNQAYWKRIKFGLENDLATPNFASIAGTMIAHACIISGCATLWSSIKTLKDESATKATKKLIAGSAEIAIGAFLYNTFSDSIFKLDAKLFKINMR